MWAIGLGLGATGRRMLTAAAIVAMISGYLALVAAEDASAAPFTCGGERATIVGTNGADTIVGTPGRDVIVARGGPDTVRGRGGHDNICGGGGNDDLRGQAGRDALAGEAGKDRLRGGPGGDLLLGFGGNDTLIGSRGPDFLNGLGGRDVLKGGAGADQLLGGPKRDRLVGQTGDDSLAGQSGSDQLRGNRGQDFLLGMGGNDFLNGGSGRFDVASFLIGGPVNANLELRVAKGQGSDTLRGIEILEGSESDDVLTGDAGPNFFWTNRGDDQIDGAGGIDGVSMFRSRVPVVVDLAAGTAVLDGSNMVLTSIENAAGSVCCADTIDGDEGPNELIGFARTDTLNGHAGDDVLDGGNGTDTGDGGEGTMDRCISVENNTNCELFGPAATASMARGLNGRSFAGFGAVAPHGFSGVLPVPNLRSRS